MLSVETWYAMVDSILVQSIEVCSTNATESSGDILVKVNLHDVIPSLISAALYRWSSTWMLDNNYPSCQIPQSSRLD